MRVPAADGLIDYNRPALHSNLVVLDTPFRKKGVDMMRALYGWVAGRMTNERGDVPGWVLIVLMTSALVVGRYLGHPP